MLDTWIEVAGNSFLFQVSFKRQNTGLIRQQLESTWRRCQSSTCSFLRITINLLEAVWMSIYQSLWVPSRNIPSCWTLFEAKIWTSLAPAVNDFTSNFLRPRCVRNTPAPGRTGGLDWHVSSCEAESWKQWITKNTLCISWSCKISSNSTHLCFSLCACLRISRNEKFVSLGSKARPKLMKRYGECHVRPNRSSHPIAILVRTANLCLECHRFCTKCCNASNSKKQWQNHEMVWWPLCWSSDHLQAWFQKDRPQQQQQKRKSKDANREDLSKQIRTTLIETHTHRIICHVIYLSDRCFTQWEWIRRHVEFVYAKIFMYIMYLYMWYVFKDICRNM